MNDLVKQFLPMFIETARDRLKKAEALAISNETKALADELHAFAGEAGVLGLFSLAARARDAETFARSLKPNYAGPDCQEHVEQLSLLVAELTPQS